jgi:hypothetical protein
VTNLELFELYLGQLASPEDLFGDHYRVWQAYHAVNRDLLPDPVWAALLMGRAVIPLNPCKKPFVKWKLYQADPPSIEQVLAWQRQFRPPIWAVVTGRRYRFLVLDFDGARGFETMRHLQIQPHVRSGSGGHHLYVEYPDDLDVRTWNSPKAPFLEAILPGTDIKSNGGYAVFTGTSKKGPYQWLRPMWPDRCTPEIHSLLVQVIGASRRSARPVSDTDGDPTPAPGGGSSSNGHPIAVSALLDWGLKRAVNGRNNAGFDLACQLRDNGYAREEAEAVLAEYTQGVGPTNQHGEYEPYTVSEALASVAQAYSSPERQPWSLAAPSSPPSFSPSLSPPPPESSGPSSSAPGSSGLPPPAGPRLVVPGGPPSGGRRRVQFKPPLTTIVEASLVALDCHYRNDPKLFMRSNRLTEVIRDEQDRPHLRRVREQSMIAHLDRAVEYLVFEEGHLRPIFPPPSVVSQIIDRPADQVPFPPLIGIARSPIMRADGTVLERATPGYDAGSRYYCAMDATVAALAVPLIPSAADLSSATALLDELIVDVCFANPPSVYRANYFALLLTPLVKLMINDNLPLFAIDATKPRSGKGLLAAIVGILANGYPTPVTTGPEPGEQGEWRKKITAFLLAGEGVICIDNVVFSLDSAELCAMATTRNYVDRILGGNTLMTADPLNSLWIFTGNALQPVGDLVKRCFWIRLDPQRSDPERRTGFKHPELLSWVADNRAPLLQALFTLVRAWVVAGQPEPKGVAAFGGFGRWLRVVAGILQTAGMHQFFQDPEQAYSDPDSEQWLPFLQAVAEVTYGDKFTIAELTKSAQDVQWFGGRSQPSDNASKLREHLPDELVKEVDTPRFRAVLGYAFRKKKSTYYGLENIHIANTGERTRDGAVLWQVRRGNQAQPGTASQPASPSPAAPSPSTSSGSSASAGSAPSALAELGAIRRKNGKVYRFDGSKWVKQP